MSQLEVPVVDISGFFTGNAAVRSSIAREVAGAVEGIGFLTIIGHGVPQNLMEDVSTAYRSFFDLPLEIKRKYVNQARNTNRGYVPYGDEFVASSHGNTAPPDWRETFAFGRFDVPEDPYYSHADAGYAYEGNILPNEAAGMVATSSRRLEAWVSVAGISVSASGVSGSSCTTSFSTNTGTTSSVSCASGEVFWAACAATWALAPEPSAPAKTVKAIAAITAVNPVVLRTIFFRQLSGWRSVAGWDPWAPWRP